MFIGAQTQFRMAHTIQTFSSAMHYTGLTIYLHFLSSFKYLGESRVEVLSDFFFPSLLFPQRKVSTKQKKEKRGGGGRWSM